MEYSDIIKILGEQLGLELDGTDGAVGLEIDGKVVILQDANDLLLIRGEIGEVPPDKAERLYRAALDANYLYQGTGGATIARNPNDGKLHLHKYNWMNRLDADQLIDSLDRFADVLEAWQKMVADMAMALPETDDSSASESHNLGMDFV